MYIFAVILTILASLFGLEWLMRNLLVLRVWRGIYHLTNNSETDLADDDKKPPLLSIVVAAKDEEAHIEACLTSLLSQDYPNFEIVVVNDRSEDATADIINKIQKIQKTTAKEQDQKHRIQAITIHELPDGWCGKNHAMQNGIAASKGQWVCMTDADCRLESTRTMSVAMSYARRTETDMLSLLPRLTMSGFWEKFLLPILSGVLMIWFPPKKVNNPDRPEAYANGMFMLIRQDAYEAIGTHEAVKGSLIEDMDLARNIKSAGCRLQMVPTRGLLSVRMYTSLEQIVGGWVRIFLGSFQTFTSLLKALLVLTGRGLMPTLTAVVGFAMYAAGLGPRDWWLACGCIGAAGLVAQLVMTARFFHYTGSRWWLGCLYPLGCGVVAGILIKTMLKLRPGAKMTWRGTHYDAAGK